MCVVIGYTNESYGWRAEEQSSFSLWPSFRGRFASLTWCNDDYRLAWKKRVPHLNRSTLLLSLHDEQECNWNLTGEENPWSETIQAYQRWLDDDSFSFFLGLYHVVQRCFDAFTFPSIPSNYAWQIILDDWNQFVVTRQKRTFLVHDRARMMLSLGRKSIQEQILVSRTSIILGKWFQINLSIDTAWNLNRKGSSNGTV